MAIPVEQWFESCEATKRLVENLRTNLEAMAGELSEANRETILRLDLIMIRQCMQDCGVVFEEPK